MPCGLNTDDRGMWDSNLTDEYYAAATRPVTYGYPRRNWGLTFPAAP